MTATQSPDGAKPTGRRGWRLVGIGVLIMVAALAAGIAIGTATTKDTPTGAAPSSVAAPISAPTSTDPTSPANTANQANGCLGGSDPAAAILPAQQAASLDTSGAAAFARTFVRWVSTYPIDPNAAEVLTQITSASGGYGSKTLNDMNQAARGMQAQGYTEARVLPDAGGYRFASSDNTQAARLDVLTERQLTRSDGRVETQKTVVTLVLQAENDKWHVVGTIPNTQSDPFADIPSAPWQSYAGAC